MLYRRGDKEKNYSETVLGPGGSGEYRCSRRGKKPSKTVKKKKIIIMNDDPNTSAAIIILPYGNVRPLMNNNQSTRDRAPSDFIERSVMMILCVMTAQSMELIAQSDTLQVIESSQPEHDYIRFIILEVFYYRFFKVLKKKYTHTYIYRYGEACIYKN